MRPRTSKRVTLKEESSKNIEVEVWGRTDVGRVREGNEDSLRVADLTTRDRFNGVRNVGPYGMCFLVCDGMGGAAAGEIASDLAASTILERLIAGQAPASSAAFSMKLVEAVQEANRRVYEASRADRSLKGMGTTCTAAALVDAHLWVAQVGDSRCYALRAGKLVQVTRDQSVAGGLVDAGQMTQEEADASGHGSVLLQALGTQETVQVVLSHVELRRGDMVLVCSDGLSSMLSPSTIAKVLGDGDPYFVAKSLVEKANAAGGDDNITCVVARFEGSGLSAPSPRDTVKYEKVLP